MGELGAPGAVVFGARAAVLRRRAGAHVLRIGFRARAAAAGASLAASIAASSGRGSFSGHACLLPGEGRDRGVPVSRAIARAWVRGRGRAYRGGAARAPDCARETAGRTSPVRSRRGVFRGPSHRFLQKNRKAAPEAASLYFHSTPYGRNVKPIREQKMKISDIFHGMPAAVERRPDTKRPLIGPTAV